jgi:streptogramin lyase
VIPEDRLRELLRGLADDDPVPPGQLEDVDVSLVRQERQQRMRRRIALVVTGSLIVGGGLVFSLASGTRTHQVNTLPLMSTPNSRVSSATAATGGVPPSPTSSSLPAAGSSAAGPKQPEALVMGPSGNVYIADDGGNQILERLASGSFVVVAGTGRAGFSGDGGPATQAAINDPQGMAFGPDGSLYFADSMNNRIRKISPDGIISTVVGSGSTASWIPNGTPAFDARLTHPDDVIVGPGGALYIAATSNNEVLRLDANGSLTIVAGSQSQVGGYGVGGSAAIASPDYPAALAFDGAGDLYIYGSNHHSLLMVTPSGTMTEPLVQGFRPGGNAAFASAPDGSVIALDGESLALLSPTGTTTLIDFLKTPVNGISTFQPNGIAVGKDGEIYTDTDGTNGVSNKPGLIRVNSTGPPAVLWEP